MSEKRRMSLCIRHRPGLLGLHALTLASPGPPPPPDFWAPRAREEQGEALPPGIPRIRPFRRVVECVVI